MSCALGGMVARPARTAAEESFSVRRALAGRCDRVASVYSMGGGSLPAGHGWWPAPFGDTVSTAGRQFTSQHMV
jgi:hypothetical protein